jgi:hypothetical protein
MELRAARAALRATVARTRRRGTGWYSAGVTRSVTLLLVVSASAAGAGATRVDPAALDAVLAAVVRGEGVDYALVRAEHLGALESYLEQAAEVDRSALAPAERLALYVNVYNATVLREVALRFTPGFTVADPALGFFERPVVRFGAARISLDRLEHEIIRGEFDEPRVHAALVCAARSCPPLAARAYRGEGIEADLESSMLRFLNDGRRNRVDVAARTLVLSRIFDWYADDFGGAPAVAAWVDRYIEPDVSGFAVTFSDYSWELNVAAPEPGRIPDR